MSVASVNPFLEKIRRLPGSDDLLFSQLWHDKRLQYRGDAKDCVDQCDDICVRLVSAAILTRRPLLIELPDDNPRRPALLLATALLRYWWDSRQACVGVHPPLVYFGSHVGIREQLSQTKIVGMGLDLAGVFDEEHTVRGSMRPQVVSDNGVRHSTLPKVITVYSPADPVGPIARYHPGMIAIDLGDSPKLEWLEPLLKCAAERHIRTIAWGQNPLSFCAAQFSSHGMVFTWPPQVGCHQVGANSLLRPEQTEIVPLLVGGTDAEEFSQHLRKASRTLAFATKLGNGQLAEDALGTHWSYLRFLEALHVPADLYEAEVTRMWGMKSLVGLRETCRKFRDACATTYPVLSSKLDEAAGQLEAAHASILETEPPLWRALSSVCFAGAEDERKLVLTFISRARLALFSYALLVRHNVTTDDLAELGIATITSDRLWNGEMNVPREKRDVVSVGLPSPFAIPKLLPLIIQKKLQMLMYPHQLASFRRRMEECDERLKPKLSVVNSLTAETKSVATAQPDHAPARLLIAEPLVLDAGSAKKRQAKKADLRVGDSAEEEVARLFALEDEEDSTLTTEPLSDSDRDPQRRHDLWCDTAYRIDFEGGLRATFAPDARINVVGRGSTGQEAVLKDVSSVRPSERVLFIQGQERQELYDLLVARVHRHPKFELHLALVRRWQDDLISSFYQQERVSSVSELLARLQSAGSQLISQLTLRFWLAKETLCPSDPEDLRRLAGILGMSFVEQHYKRIARAADRIRGLHRGLAIRLNHWIQEQLGEAKSSASDLIDQELGLKFSDFKNSLLLLRVDSITEQQGPFLRSRLGYLTK